MTDAVQNEAFADLDVSESWIKKFELLKKLGVDDRSFLKAMGGEEFKVLSFKDRNSVLLNPMALLFGPLYYFVKGMWQKGALLLAFSWLLAGVFILIGDVVPSVLYWVVPAVLCAQMANADYYKLKVNGERVWSVLPDFFQSPLIAIAAPAFALLLALFALNVTAKVALQCSSPVVLNGAMDLARQQFVKAGVTEQMFNSWDASFKNVQQQGQADTNLSCAAEFDVRTPGKHSVIPVTYTIESTASGQPYITLYGLY